MDSIGIDVHQHQSPMCLISEAGGELHQRLHTQRERFAAVFAERPKARILLEASTAQKVGQRASEEAQPRFWCNPRRR